MKEKIERAKILLFTKHITRTIVYGDCAEIAREVGLSPRTVQKIARDHGFRRISNGRKPETYVPIRPDNKPPWKPRTQKAQEIATTLILESEEGMFYRDGQLTKIAAQHQTTKQNVHQIAGQLRMRRLPRLAK